MRKQKKFTQEQIEELLKSPFIEKVHSNHLEYSIEFKQLAVTQYLQGKTPVEIFVNAGLNLELIGRKDENSILLSIIKKF